MKRLIKNILVFIIPLTIMLIVNIVIDDASLINQSKEKEIVKILSEGKNVENVKNYNDRFLIKELIKTNRKYKTIVLGSSRHLQVGEKELNKNMFNYSIVGSSIKDYLAILNLLEENNKLPDSIFLGIDPWVFNKNNQEFRWQELSSDYYSFLSKLNISVTNESSAKSKNNELIKELINPSYFLDNLKVLLKIEKSEVWETKNSKSNYNIKLKDGSISYRKTFREPTLDVLKQRIKSQTKNNKIYKIEGFSVLNKDIQKQLEKTIDYLKSKNITVNLVLSPYEKSVWKIIESKEKYINVIKSEEYLKNLVEHKKLNIFGTYNGLNFKSEDFYDAIHPKNNIMKKILNPIKN